jgi:UDP-4-amino-4,6-dideoxy-N-acetyl-beta-L-altrosamine N-acetyltransferase
MTMNPAPLLKRGWAKEKNEGCVMAKKGIVSFRQIEKEDLGIIRDWRNKEKIRQTFREYRLLNMENQLEWFKKISHSKTDDMFMILLDSHPIGVCGLTNIDWKDRHTEYSFYVGEDIGNVRSGRVAMAIFDFLKRKCFKEYNLNRMWGEIAPFNKVSVKLAVKNGLIEEGVKRQCFFSEGRYFDIVVVGMLAEEYYKQRLF